MTTQDMAQGSPVESAPPVDRSMFRPSSRLSRGRVSAGNVIDARRRLERVSQGREKPRLFAGSNVVNPIAAFVHGVMMTSTEEKEVVETGLAAIGPVSDVVEVAESVLTAGKPTVAVPEEDRPLERRRHDAGLSSYIEDIADGVVSHGDLAPIAGEPPRRFRGNATGPLDEGLTFGLRIRQSCLVDMDDDLESVVTAAAPLGLNRLLGDECEGVCPALGLFDELEV